MSLGNTVKFMALIAGMFCFQSFFIGDETMTKEDGEGCQNASGRCRDWCHFLFRGRHPERADGARLLSEEQIINKRSSQGSAYCLL